MAGCCNLKAAIALARMEIRGLALSMLREATEPAIASPLSWRSKVEPVQMRRLMDMPMQMRKEESRRMMPTTI